MFHGACPKCGNLVTKLLVDSAVTADEAGINGLRELKAYTLLCPHPNCRTVLGAHLDPKVLYKMEEPVRKK